MVACENFWAQKMPVCLQQRNAGGLDRHIGAGHHGFAYGTASLDDLAVFQHLPPGQTQGVADRDRVEGDFFIRSIRSDAPGGLGSEVEQGAGRVARAIPIPVPAARGP